MKQEEYTTLDNILNAAKTEFLEKGFQKASLRKIVKTAGVTTGAFYRYYPSKEALFAALIEETADHIFHIFTGTVEVFQQLPGEQQSTNMRASSSKCLQDILDYIYEHYDSFKLLINCAGGTPYEDFTQRMVQVEEACTYQYIEDMEKLGAQIPAVDRRFSHTVICGMFNSMFELIVHDTPKEEAAALIRQLQEFYTAGWTRTLGVKF